MADAAVQLRPGQAGDALNVVISGMLREQRKHDGTFYSTIISPAADQYSSPMPFEVRSSKPLGSRDQIVSVPCRLGGFFKRQYEVVNQQTGESRRVKPIVLTLDAIDGADGF